jgi:hypothetical protein
MFSTDRHKDGQVDGQMNIKRDRRIDGSQTDMWMYRQKDRQVDR